MDSSLRWKALQYFVKKAYEPLILSTFEEKGALTVHIINDHQHAVSGILSVRLIDFNGRVLNELRDDVTVSPVSSEVYVDLECDAWLNGFDPTRCVIVSELLVGENCVNRSLHYLNRVKDLNLLPTALDCTVSQVKGGCEIALSAKTLTKNVYLTINEEDGLFSDNYFDLLPAEAVVIYLKTDVSKESVQRLLCWQTLNDLAGSYAGDGDPE